MLKIDSNTVIIIGVVLLVVVIFIYFNKSNNNQPMNRYVETFNNLQQATYPYNNTTSNADIINEMMLPQDNANTSVYDMCDPIETNNAPFNDYTLNNDLNHSSDMRSDMRSDMKNASESDPRDFTYKKKQFTTRSTADIEDLFDVDKMLPHEIESDWFDVEPLMTTKKVKGTHLIHPKTFMGRNTVQSSLRNPTHDIRGDIPNPKMKITPFNNSTIEPDINIRGLC